MNFICLANVLVRHKDTKTQRKGWTACVSAKGCCIKQNHFCEGDIPRQQASVKVTLCLRAFVARKLKTLQLNIC
jgi:hypothetical protein